MIVRPSTATRDGMLAAIAWLANGGAIEIYDGPLPARADDDVGDQILLARLPFGTPAFGGPINGAIGARPIDPQPALARGRASWARISDGSGAPLIDVDVAESGAALNLVSTELFERGPVEIYALVLRMPAS